MMERLKFGTWAIVMLLLVFTFAACNNDDDDDQRYVPSTNTVEALKQLYPGAQKVQWEMKGRYNVADCWVNGDDLDVWFDAYDNWVMTENELDNVNQLLPAVITAFKISTYYKEGWQVDDVYVLTYPLISTVSVIQVKKAGVERALYYSQNGDLSYDDDITGKDDTNWPPTK